MKTAFLLGAIFLLGLLAPPPHAGVVEAGAPLQVESAVPEMGQVADAVAGLRSLRADGSVAIDGYLWSESRATGANGGLLVDGSAIAAGGELGSGWSPTAWEAE